MDQIQYIQFFSISLMVNMVKYVIIVVLIIVSTAHSAKFPSKWKKCQKNDEKCLKTAAEEAIIDLKNGNKGLHMIPLEPLHFQRMELNQGSSSPVNINLTFYELDLIGFSRTKINKMRFDMDKHEVEIDMNIKDGDAYLVGDYTISGSVLVLPVNGKGKSNITFEDLNMVLKMTGSEVTKDGKKYFHVDNSDFDLRPKKVRFWFGNLFDGVPNLGEQMNTFLNENWVEIMGELKGTISKAMGLGITQVSNSFFTLIPIDQIIKQ